MSDRGYVKNYSAQDYLFNNELIDEDGGPECNACICILCGRMSYGVAWGNRHSQLFYDLIEADKAFNGVCGETRVYNDLCRYCIRIIPEGRAENVINEIPYENYFNDECYSRCFDPLFKFIKSSRERTCPLMPIDTLHPTYKGYYLSYDKMAIYPRLDKKILIKHVMKKLFKVIDSCIELPYLPEEVKGLIEQYVV